MLGWTINLPLDPFVEIITFVCYLIDKHVEQIRKAVYYAKKNNIRRKQMYKELRWTIKPSSQPFLYKIIAFVIEKYREQICRTVYDAEKSNTRQQTTGDN